MNISPSPDIFSGRIRETWRHTLLMSFQSLGVVYGRLSTAPLYVYGTIPAEEFKSKESVYEYFSFIFWTLTIISFVKYALIVLKADDEGEGGPFALYSLLCRHAKVGLLPSDTSINEVMHDEEKSSSRGKCRALEQHESLQYLMLISALFGACMIIGDGVLTPSISVLSASSGLQRYLSEIKYSSHLETQRAISEAFRKYLPVLSACAILVCIFALQRCGTRNIGFIFAPIVILWLLFIGGVGLYNIIHTDPKIIAAISPSYIYRFVRFVDRKSWRTLGSILLCVAGSEAMFADLGHFSRKSIKVTFVSLIYPLLILCYAGQAAFISKNLDAFEDFNHLSRSVPKHLRHVFVFLSLLASAVGSQATITASFSIINQCLAFGCFPRVRVIHTSNKRHGQVYVPDVNWLLMLLSLITTITFHDVRKIASAAGLAIVSAMLVTTCLMSLVIALYWERKLYEPGCFLLFFGFIEGIYLSACMMSFHKGAWYLALLLAFLLTIMLAWHYGTKKKYEFDLENKVSTEWLTDLSPGLGVLRVPGIGFICTDIVTGIPSFFSHFITNLPAFHQVLIFVSFKSLPVPHVHSSQQYLVGRVGAKDYRIYRCIVRYGYCDHVRDTGDFEEAIIHSIGEFVSSEENDPESLICHEGRMLIVGKPLADGHALIPLQDTQLTAEPANVANNEIQASAAEFFIERGGAPAPARRKKVRFTLPANSPRMSESVREELQHLVDARESGTAYVRGQSHLAVRGNTNIFKKFLIKTYLLIDKNCREPPVALNIPHAALLEVGMVYTI